MKEGLKMRKKYEREIPRADGGSYGISTDIYNLPIGTKFDVFNGNWKGKIIEKDSKKFIEVSEDVYGGNIKELELNEDFFYDLVISITGQEEVESLSLGSYYRHYKGGLYIVLNKAMHTEDEIELVIYKDQEGKVWARPLEMFMDKLEYNGKIVKRFSKI